MDRLFDRFGFPSSRRVFDMEPSWRPASSFNFSVPAIDMSEDDKAYRISAELPGIDAKDIDMSVSGDFSKGVLTITLPKTAEAQKPQKKIEVRSA
jgi:HSP20 family protein